MRRRNLRFTGLLGAVLVLATGACGTAADVGPAAEVSPSIVAADDTAPLEPSVASVPAAPSTAALPPEAPPPEAAPCITSGMPDDGSDFVVPAAEEPAVEEPAIEEPAEEPPVSVSGFAPRPAEEPLPTSPTVSTDATIDPMDVPWLAPVAPPCGLRLVEARRELASPCGALTDCARTMPQATLRYDSDDPAVFRHVHLVQQLGNAPTGVGYDEPGDVLTLAGREVTIHTADGGVTTAIWAEPFGTVMATALSITVDDLAGFIASLTPFEPTVWPGDQVVAPDPVCVDDTTRYAPTALPDGWKRVVLDIAANGACDVAPFLFMSLVVPGTEVAPGTLVTFVIGPGGGSVPAGEVSEITIGEHPATLSEEVDATGRPANTVVFRIGEITIDAHGSADVDTLIALAESVELVDVATWDQLTAELQSPDG